MFIRLETTHSCDDTGKKLHETGLGNDVLDKALKPWATKTASRVLKPKCRCKANNTQ